MAPILELIKKNAVPVNVMRSAARGALPLPAEETLEVLVYMAQHPLFGQDARMTLAGWDPQSALEVLSKDTTMPEVLLYYWQPENRRPVLMPALIENPAITENLLMELADALSESGSRRLVAPFIRELSQDPKVQIIPVTAELFQRGLRLYEERQGKGWTLTDCTSFVVMRDENVTDALTGDHHFGQAGFKALLM